MGDGLKIREIYDPSANSPLPVAVRVDDVVYAWRLRGTPTAGGAPSVGPVAHMADALEMMRRVLDRAGVGVEHVARATGFIRDPADRETVYEPWDALYPDPSDRPAFKVLITDLEDGLEAELQALAFGGGHRERFDVTGVSARDPTVRLGPWLFSSRVHGTDRSTGEVPPGLEAQVARAYENLDALLHLAGGDPTRLVQITAYARDLEMAPAIQQRLAQLTAAAEIKPAIRIVKSFVRPQIETMLEMSASLTDDWPIVDLANPAVPGDPVPAGVEIGPCLILPAIRGLQATTGHLAEGYDAQIREALQNVERVLDRAGTSLDSVANVTILLKDLEGHGPLNRVWPEFFPDPADRPPHAYVVAPLPDGVLAQVQVIALRGQRRTVLEIPGLAHQDPMSMGVRIGSAIFSSRIAGSDTGTGVLGTNAQDQARLAFDNVQTLLQRAGATLQQLTQVIAFIPDATYRGPVEIVFRGLAADLPSEPALDFVEGPVTGPPAVRLQIKAAL